MRRVKRKKFTDKVSIMMLTICQLARRMADAAADARRTQEYLNLAVEELDKFISDHGGWPER